MNKMQGLAKTLITILAGYWLIKIAINSIFPIFMIIQSFSKTGYEASSIFFILLYIFIMIFIMLVIAEILRKRDKIAIKIAGIEEIENVDAQVKWVPFSYRLISIAAGMYFFVRAAEYMPRLLGNFISERGYKAGFGNYGTITSVFIFMILGTYLLCGAPHFVRWQARKTMESCVED